MKEPVDCFTDELGPLFVASPYSDFRARAVRPRLAVYKHVHCICCDLPASLQPNSRECVLAQGIRRAVRHYAAPRDLGEGNRPLSIPLVQRKGLGLFAANQAADTVREHQHRDTKEDPHAGPSLFGELVEVDITRLVLVHFRHRRVQPGRGQWLLEQLRTLLLHFAAAQHAVGVLVQAVEDRKEAFFLCRVCRVAVPALHFSR